MSSASRWAIPVLVFGCLALAACRPRPEPVPALDLDGLEPEVARKIESLRRLLENDPTSAERWGRLAVNLDVHDLRRQSIPFYARAAALDPSEMRWPYYGAIALEDMGSEEAPAWFERARQLAPDYPPVHVRYARALFDRGRLEEAERAFQRAIAADPRAAHAYLGLARIALVRGDPEASRQHLLQALAAAPELGEAHGLLAEVYRRLERPQEARRELQRAAPSPSPTPLPDPLLAYWSAEGSSVYWRVTRGHAALERGDFEQAVRELALALEARPDADEYNNLGLALRRLGRLAEAEESFRDAVAVEPSHRGALVNLGTALDELGRPDEAIASIEQALAVDPTFAEGYANLGNLYLETGRFADAAGVFRRGLGQAPEDLRLTLRLAWVLATAPSFEVRDGIEAARLAQKVCDATGNRNAGAMDVLAAALAETGDFERAVATAARARDLAVAGRRAELVEQIGSRLTSYRNGRPYRQPMGSR